MASKRRLRRLSLPKNWRVVKKTRNNGSVFYHAQSRDMFWGLVWSNSYHGEFHSGDKFYNEDAVKKHIISEITEYARRYDEKCGSKVEKKEIINFE